MWLPAYFIPLVVFACVTTAAVAYRAIIRYGLWLSGGAVLISSGGLLFSVFGLGDVLVGFSSGSEFDGLGILGLVLFFSGLFAFCNAAFFLILIGRMHEARKHL